MTKSKKLKIQKLDFFYKGGGKVRIFRVLPNVNADFTLHVSVEQNYVL